MKNLSIGFNVLLLIAVIVLYILHFSGNSKSTSNQGGTVTVNADAKIVYINMDTLLNNYTQSRELNEAFLKKLEANRTELNIKVKNFDREAAEFRNKVENGGFMTRERAEQAQMDLMIKHLTSHQPFLSFLPYGQNPRSSYSCSFPDPSLSPVLMRHV